MASFSTPAIGKSTYIDECRSVIMMPCQRQTSEVSDMPKIDPAKGIELVGTTYPAQYAEPCKKRKRIRIGDVAGLSSFGVNICELPPGAWSSLPHWHTQEDEFVFVLDGEVVLVCGTEEQILRAGECAGFKSGHDEGHCLQNRSEAPARILEVGSRDPSDVAFYPGIDLMMKDSSFAHRSGVLYPPQERQT